VNLLGLAGLRIRSFGGMGILILQIIIAAMNMVTGIFAVSFYALYVAPTLHSASPSALLPIALFAFIFGVLSFTIACLAVVPIFNLRTSEPVSADYEVYQPAQMSPQITTREYVTQRRQTVSEQAWMGLACPNCGRVVSREDSFCDGCGAQFRGISQRSGEIRVESIETP